MAEQLASQDSSAQSPPYGWEQVAQEYQDWHEGLHPHVERHLAQQGVVELETRAHTEAVEPMVTAASLDSSTATEENWTGEVAQEAQGLTLFTRKLQQLRKNLEADPEDYYYLLYPDELSILQEGDYTEEELADFVHECDRMDKMLVSISGKDEYSASYDHRQLFNALRALPIDKLRALYFSDQAAQEGGLYNVFLEIASDTQGDTPFEEAEWLRDIYGLKDILSLKSQESAHQLDEVVQRVTSSEAFDSYITLEIWNRYEFGFHEAATESELQKESTEIRDWGDRYLEAIVGLPRDIRDDYQFASFSRHSNPETGNVMSNQFMESLNTVKKNVQALGLERVRALRDKAGIVNFDYYSPEQLQRMAEVLEGNQTTIEHLKTGDVTVVLTDGRGDHNGAMRTNGQTFDTPAGRGLFFEINRPSDFYRHMILLKNLGIQPSTLVVAAHGTPGVIGLGQPGSGFLLANEINLAERSSNDMKQVSIPEATGWSRLVREFMQDSRAIDDNIEALGRRRLVLKSCSQAAPAVVSRQETSGEYVKLAESTAETLTKQAAYPLLDVFAGEKDFYAEPTERGLKMHEETAEGSKEWKHFAASHLAMDAQGNIIQSYVDEVILRREEKGEEAFNE